MPALGGGSPSDEVMVDYVGNMMEQEFGIGIPHHDDTAYIEVPSKITELHNVMNNGGKLGWTCLHCGFNCKGPFNATKLKAHLARIPGQDVRSCTATNVAPNVLDMYKRQWQQYLDKKNHKKRKYIEQEEQSEQLAAAHVAAMIQRGTSREATNLRSAQQQQQLIANQPNRLTKSTESKKKNAFPGKQRFLTGKHPGVSEANLKMDSLITSFILRGGRAFNTVEDPDLLQIIRHARFIGDNYKPPDRKKISGDLLNLQYDELYARNVKALKDDADIFGIALYSDGATIAKTPFINVLGSGWKITNACLEIHDCNKQLVEGGKKDAQYITTLISKHIDFLDPRKELVDMVIFDGASNMQKAARALESLYPLVTGVHGAEHVVSLFFSDIAKTEIGGIYVKVYKQFYKWFGGRHQAVHSIFMEKVQSHNNRKIGLVRASET
jgi:hypothetical protein